MTGWVRFGPFEADLGSGELFCGERRVWLQRQPFRLLAILIEHAGLVMSRDALRAHLWPDGTVVDFEHSLNTAVRKIRRALGDSPERPRFVETVTGRGYRLCVRVESLAPRRHSPRHVPAAALDLEPGASHEVLRAELRQLAASLAAELAQDPEGEVATLVAALFVGSEDAFRRAQELRRQASFKISQAGV